MTDAITNNTKPQVKAYAQANAGIVHNPAGKNFSNIGATLGGEVNYKSTYLKAQGGAGTALSGKIELGHEFDIGKNMGLEVSAKAQTTRSLVTNELQYNSNKKTNYKLGNGIQYETNFSDEVEVNWKPGETRVGMGTKLNFKSKLAKIGIGVEGGMRKSTNKDVNLDLSRHVEIPVTGNTTYIDYNPQLKVKLKEKKGYITPTVSAEVKMGKKSNLSFVADADMYQGKAGIRYTF